MIRTNTEEYKLLSNLLAEGESVGVEVKERKYGFGYLSGEAHVYATSSRLIIVKRQPVSFHNAIKIIRYEDIADVQLERGPLFASVHFDLLGEQTLESRGGVKWIDGLLYAEAVQLVNYVNKQIELMQSRTRPRQPAP